MRTLRTSCAVLSLAGSFAAVARSAEAPPSPAALLVGKRCGGCHSIGEGDRTGPDLLGVTKRRDKKWIATFVRNPGAAIDGGDPVAGELFAKFKNVRMPEQALTDDELAGVLAYLDDCTAKGGCKLVLGKVKHASQATQAEVDLGRAIFEGRHALAGGGPACMSCHNTRGVGLLGGGTLAKDLTFAYARLGDNGVTSALETTPFPLMKDIYPPKPLQPAEQFAIKAYLASLARDGTPPRPDHDFVLLGLLALSLSLGGISAAWSHRLRGVRQQLVRKESSS